MTQFGSNIGTLEYMSPEQIKADEIDHRTDVYSFGCVVYEMLAGHPPFGSLNEGKTDFDVMNGHMNTPPPALKQLNPDMDENADSVLSRAMAKDPNERFGSCKQMATAFAAGAATSESDRNDSSESTQPSIPSTAQSEHPRRPYLFLIIIVLLLIAVIAVSAGWLTQKNQIASLRKQLSTEKTADKKLRPNELGKQLGAVKAENKKLRESITRLAAQLEKTENELEKLKGNR
jgi:serine/threonine-protein kinase